MKQQIEHARRNMRQLKEQAPYLFVEHARLTSARIEYDKAKKELAAAESAWRRLFCD